MVFNIFTFSSESLQSTPKIYVTIVCNIPMYGCLTGILHKVSILPIHDHGGIFQASFPGYLLPWGLHMSLTSYTRTS